MEIVCDAALVAYIATVASACLKTQLAIEFVGLSADYRKSGQCHFSVVLSDLESGSCAFYPLLMTQPLFQEVALLLFSVVGAYLEKHGE